MNKLTWSQSSNQHVSMHVTLPNIKDIEGKPWHRFTISEELKALLIKQGWTPPSDRPPLPRITDVYDIGHASLQLIFASRARANEYKAWLKEQQ